MPTVVNSDRLLNPLDIRQQLGISQERMSNLLKVSSKTITRWEKDERLPNDSEALSRLAKLKEITELGLMVYTAVGFQEFLKTPLPVFGGRCAFDLFMLSDYETVLSAIAADFEGIGY